LRTRLDAHGRKTRLLLVQVEEQASLRLRRPDLDEPPVVQDEPQHVRANPPGGVARELHTTVRVVSLDGLHQADVPLLDEIHDVAVRAPVFVRELHHEPEVRRDEPRGGIHVAGLRIVDGDAMLLLGSEQRVPLDLVHVDLKRIRPREPSGVFSTLGECEMADLLVGDDFAFRLYDRAVRFAGEVLIGFFSAVSAFVFSALYGFFFGIRAPPRRATGFSGFF